MAKLLKLRRGTTSQHSSFTGAEGEVTVDTDKDVLVVHDGSTAGGHPVAAQDMDNVPAGAILGTQLENSGVTAGSYGSSSAIPIVTVDAQGLVTGASTTAIDSTTIANGTSNVAVANNGDITATRSGTARLVVDNNGVDVTGTLTSTGDLTVNSDNLVISSGYPSLFLTDTSNDSDYKITNNQGQLIIFDTTNSATRLAVNPDGHLDIPSNVDFGAGIDVTGNITATGSIASGDIEITGTAPSLVFQDQNNENDFAIKNQDGTFKVRDVDAGVDRFTITTAGVTGVSGNLDVGAGLDVTGNITATGTLGSSDVTITSSDPTINLVDSGNNPDYMIQNNSGQLRFRDTTSNSNRLVIESDGHVDVIGNLDVGAGIDVTGNITVSGTVDGVDIAARNTLFGGLTSSSGVLTNGVVATTQAAGNETQRVATTAFVATAINNAQAFPSGTKMLFQQTSAPTGWTKITSGVNNKALRVVSGSVGSGGNVAFTTVFGDRGISANAGNTTAGGNVSISNAAQGGNINISSVSTSGNVNDHTLTTNQIPSHSHNYTRPNYQTYAFTGGGGSQRSSSSSGAGTSNTGGGGAHGHGFTGSSHNHNATFTGSNHSHSGGFSGNAHNHNISVGNLDMQAEYLDVIIASKD